jgi:hypothetical protein
MSTVFFPNQVFAFISWSNFSQLFTLQSPGQKKAKITPLTCENTYGQSAIYCG